MIALRRAAFPLLAMASLGCTAPRDDPTFSFSLDPAVAPGEEAYVCFDFDAPELAGTAVQRVAWEPGSGPVALHHATLFAISGPVSPGESACDASSEHAIVLHVWTPGSSGLALPGDVALALPDWVSGLRVEAHALRLDEGAPLPSTVTLIEPPAGPAHLAAWVDDRAPVPKLPPHSSMSSSATCRFSEAARVVSTWPHMHRAGSEFHGAVVRKGGEREALVDVAPWDFNHQLTYPVSADLAPGDGVETTCAWQNTSESYIHPGLLSSDEMCNQGLIVWPASAAACAP